MNNQGNTPLTDRSMGMPLGPSADSGIASNAATGSAGLPGERKLGNGEYIPELRRLLDELTDLARSTQGELRTDLERLLARARDRLATSLEHGREVRIKSVEQLQRGVAASRETVVDHPVSSVLTSVATVILIGLLLSRRR
jgi:ElaB/YqjD/DUF883 family membrane-anchored ribosome-binding protein